MGVYTRGAAFFRRGIHFRISYSPRMIKPPVPLSGNSGYEGAPGPSTAVR